MLDFVHVLHERPVRRFLMRLIEQIVFDRINLPETGKQE
jgi:hypothetical protein